MFAKFRIISIIGGKVRFTLEWQSEVVRNYDYQDFDVLAWLKGWVLFDSFIVHDQMIAIPHNFIALTPPFERR